MVKSFSVALNNFSQCYPKGISKSFSKRKLDALDLVNHLSWLGYTVNGYAYRSNSLCPELEEHLTRATLGIPTHAKVTMRRVSKYPHVTLIFEY